MTGFSKDWPAPTDEERQAARERRWELSEDGSCWTTDLGDLIAVVQPPPITRPDPATAPEPIHWRATHAEITNEDAEYEIMDGCVCPGGWQNCLDRGCAMCWGADTWEEPPPCDLEAEGY